MMMISLTEWCHNSSCQKCSACACHDFSSSSISKQKFTSRPSYFYLAFCDRMMRVRRWQYLMNQSTREHNFGLREMTSIPPHNSKAGNSSQWERDSSIVLVPGYCMFRLGRWAISWVITESLQLVVLIVVTYTIESFEVNCKRTKERQVY